jgi:ribulose-5-phosphate 4-epimerase/fuculose-1-phosphate aldolase
MNTATKASFDPAQLPLRTELAACVRLMHDAAILNYNGHVSARLEGEDRLVIHSLVTPRSEVGPGDFVVCGLDGAVLEAAPGHKPPSEVFIHSEIYKARPDVGAIAHIHSESVIAFTLTTHAPCLKLVRCDAVRWRSGIPMDLDPTRIRSREQGAALAATLGPHRAALMRAHGAVLVAPGPRAVFADTIQFDENARAQLLAATLGTPAPLTDAELDALEEASPPEFMDHYVNKIWRYYVERGRAAGLIPDDWAAHLN